MSPKARGEGPAAALDAVRAQIERVDWTIVQLLGERLRAASVLVASKREMDLPVLDPEHEARVVRRASEWAREASLPDEEVRDIFWRIIAITRRAQDEQQSIAEAYAALSSDGVADQCRM